MKIQDIFIYLDEMFECQDINTLTDEELEEIINEAIELDI